MMRRFCYRGLIAATALGMALSTTSFGETGTTVATSEPGVPEASEVAAAKSASKGNIIGTLDLRGEYYLQGSAFDTSNYAQLGYQFNPNFKMQWTQGFDSNINNATLYGKQTQGLNFILDQGYLRTQVANIWKSGNLSLSYENRIYVPTLFADADRGNITQIYNYLKLANKITPDVTLSAGLVFMPQIYRTAGTTQFGANSWLQNRFYLIADINITKKLSLDLPLLVYQTMFRTYEGGRNSGATSYIVYIWPELDYAVTDKVTLGLAYVSDNLMAPDLSRFTIWQGLKQGIVQVAVTTTL
jgi:hypothetical protein